MTNMINTKYVTFEARIGDAVGGTKKGDLINLQKECRAKLQSVPEEDKDFFRNFLTVIMSAVLAIDTKLHETENLRPIANTVNNALLVAQCNEAVVDFISAHIEVFRSVVDTVKEVRKTSYDAELTLDTLPNVSVQPALNGLMAAENRVKAAFKSAGVPKSVYDNLKAINSSFHSASQAYVAKAPNLHLRNVLSDQYSQLDTKIVKPHFYEGRIYGDGDCGFRAIASSLDVTRESTIAHLISNKANDRIRGLVCPEIMSAIRSEEFIPHSSSDLTQYNQNNDIISAAGDSDVSALVQSQEELLAKIAMQQNVFEHYIASHYGRRSGGGKEEYLLAPIGIDMKTGVLDVIAEMQQQPIYIWVPDHYGTAKLARVARPLTGSVHGEPVHIIFRSDDKHFNKLVPTSHTDGRSTTVPFQPILEYGRRVHDSHVSSQFRIEAIDSDND